MISVQCGKSVLLLMPLATSGSVTLLYLSVSHYFSHEFFISYGFIILISFFFFFLTWPCHLACGILVPNLGSNPRTAPALEARSLNHWTSREVPVLLISFQDPFAVILTPSLVHTDTYTQNHRHLHIPHHHFLSQLTYILASNT